MPQEGADLGYRAGCDCCDCIGWVGTTDVVEDGDHYSRPQGVRTLRERAHDGQMGHGREPYLQASNFNLQKSYICRKIINLLLYTDSNIQQSEVIVTIRTNM